MNRTEPHTGFLPPPDENDPTAKVGGVTDLAPVRDTLMEAHDTLSNQTTQPRLDAAFGDITNMLLSADSGLWSSTYHGDLEAAREQLLAGDDPSLASSDGVTPLMVAVLYMGPDAARPRHPAHGKRSQRVDLLRLLLAHGADPNATEKVGGSTALHFAAVNGSLDCVEVLVRAGCDTSLRTVAGSTVAQVASIRGNKVVLQRLQSLARAPFIGVVVELAGLVGGADHNGKLAAVLRYKPEKKRFELELLEDGKRMDVRPIGTL